MMIMVCVILLINRKSRFLKILVGKPWKTNVRSRLPIKTYWGEFLGITM